MARFDPRLLVPPQEAEEAYPYRRVWRSIGVESAVLLVVTVVVFVLFSIVGVPLSVRSYRVVGVLLVFVPVVLWFVFSWWQERFVPQPRRRLLAVLILSALVANGVGVPLVEEFFQVDRWLPLGNAVNRILGYAFTVGIVQEFLKYLVVRYVVWPVYFRVRLDAVAYGAACAVGYSTVVSLHFVLTGSPAPDAVALRVFENLVVHLVAGFLVAYGLSELRFGTPTPLLGVLTVAVASFVVGVVIPVRSGLVNAVLGLPEAVADGVNWVSGARLVLGFGFAVVLLVVAAFVIAFLFSSAEEREYVMLSEAEL